MPPGETGVDPKLLDIEDAAPDLVPWLYWLLGLLIDRLAAGMEGVGV